MHQASGQVAAESILVEKAKQGETAAFEQLVKRYRGKTYSLAFSFVGNHEDALDISQDSFTKAFSSLSTFESGSKFFPWFFAIIKNNCLNHLRNKDRRGEGSLEAFEEDGWQFVDRCKQPDEVATQKDSLEIVRAAVDDLNPEHRAVVVLRHFQELSYKEIASKIGCPIGTVMSRLHVARNYLKASLAAVGILGFDLN